MSGEKETIIAEIEERSTEAADIFKKRIEEKDDKPIPKIITGWDVLKSFKDAGCDDYLELSKEVVGEVYLDV